MRNKNKEIEKIDNVREIVKEKFNIQVKQYENTDLIINADKMANEILSLKTSNRHRDIFFPYMIDKMNYKVGAEIGVDKGGFTERILSRSKIEKYYCIDTWQDCFGSGFKKDYFDKDGSVRFNQANETLKDYKDRIVMMRMNSMEAAKQIPDNSLDFIYIDGDHSLEMIFDIYAYMPKLKMGGTLAGHDYKDGRNSGISDHWGQQLDYKIKTAVDYYCDRYGHALRIVGGMIMSWYFIKNR
jgi:hypothetical protein